MALINYEVRLQLKCSTKCILVADNAANQVPTFKINDTKLYVPVVTFSTQGNVKLVIKIWF